MAKCLVTGGAGFIGSHIVEALLARGDEVTILDNFSSGKRGNLPSSKHLHLIEGDVSDPKAAASAVKGIEVVFHEAAMGSVSQSIAEPLKSHTSNATGTLQMLIASKEAKVSRFVNAASTAIYEDSPELPKNEGMPPNPLSPYAATKMGQELYCRAFSASYGMETISLRYFNVYGPRQDPKSEYAAVVPRFFDFYLLGQPPTIYGDGEQTRDFIYVKDVVDANLRAADRSGSKGEVFNIASGKAITVNQLAKEIAAITGSSIKPKHGPERRGEIRHSLADIRLAKDQLGFEARTSLTDGLLQAFEWYKKVH